MSPLSARRLRRPLSARRHASPRSAWRHVRLLLVASLGGCTCNCGEECDRIQVDQDSGSPPAVVLVDAHAMDDPAPPDCATSGDRQYDVDGVISLPQNLTAGCTNEVAIFAANRAPLVVLLEDDRWTPGPDHVKSDALPALLELNVHVWLFTTDPAAPSRAAEHVDYASWIFKQNRAGVHVTIAAQTKGESLTYEPWDSCPDIEDTLPGFDPAADVFHVVYVQDIDGPSRGHACFVDANRGDVVILSFLRAQDATLAHEIVHMLGFSSPPFPWGYDGHVNDYATEGFTGKNVMWIFDPPEDVDGRTLLTLGQLYRMHVDSRSWLNRAKLRTEGHTADCPGNSKKGPCPRLAQDWVHP